MNPSESRLRELLEQLHAELARATTLDADARAALEHLRNDIQAALDASEISAQHSRAIRARGANILDQFEDAHPQITLLVKSLLDHLAAV